MPHRAPPTVTRAPTPPECDKFEEDAPLILKDFLTDVKQCRATTENKEMTFPLDPEVRDWVRNHYDIVCERFPGMLELTDNMIIVMFPTLMHQFMVVLTSLPDNCWKSLRDLLMALLGIYHQGQIGGGIATKVFRNTNREITKVTYSLVSFLLDGTQGEQTAIGTKFQMYHNTNDLGGQYYSGTVLVNSDIIDETSLSPEHDIVINAKVLGLGQDAEPMHLQAKDIWVEQNLYASCTIVQKWFANQVISTLKRASVFISD
ncbi:hypothetical protein EV421DRAFT_1739568 [Armillaria borealis]|uniref:Uncharacterized protein n=1 Tax=Armillaria borealis TaxID=47425 RepID=A0AA39J8U2_9AGAR|nr:hypothetical protein EV421DRAFT_1739568 [Armillaria borealis]